MTESTVPGSIEKRPWWVWLNVLGLDAVATALLWLCLFARAAGAHLIPAEYVVLGCAVWCVYIADRMLDGRMAAGPRGGRHVFAARHWWWLSLLMLTAAGISAWLLLYEVREIVSRWGLKLLVVTAGYFGVTWFSRKPGGLVGAASLAGILAIALMQAAGTEAVWAQLWRGALAGVLVTVVFLSLRTPSAGAPWMLPRKLAGGWLFAGGTALAPYAHLEMAQELILGGPVLLFGTVCALNSLGIRLWERGEPDFESRLLKTLYPWMLVIAAAGAVMEWSVADKWTRLVLGASGLSALLLLVLHLWQHRLPASLRPLLADGALMISAVLMLLPGGGL